jgi:hypothetical protein
LLVIVIGSLAAVGATDMRRITLTKIGEYRTGVFGEGGSEIVAYDAATQRLFSINAANTTVDIIDLSDPTQPSLVSTIDATAYGAGANSVAVDRGRVAVAIQADPKTDPGKVVFFNADGQYLADVTVGALPDMVTFSRRGNFVLVANEGEPNDDYSVDPEGTVSIIRVGPTLARLDQSAVTTVDFTAFNNATLDPSIRIFGPGATVAQDLEPEYIAPADNERWAYVTLQENNAMAIIDVRRGTVKELVGLGFKDHMAAGNGLDASDRDGAINIANWPVYGMFQPDGIAAYRSNRGLMLITANEGDSRDYDTFSEEARVKDLTLDPTAFPNAAALQADEAIGRLTVTNVNGLKPGTDTYEALYAFGGRSFSIWDRRGNLMFDSGDMLEQITAAAYPDDFNSTNDENDTFDNRSDNKGPEPEGVVVGNVGRGTFAFIGLERIGGVAVFEVSRPRQPQFVQYINSRDFAGDPQLDTAGDLGPEGLTFIHQRQSPTGRPLLIVGNEVSGSIAIFEISQP